jgi:hypothetical protein
MNIRYEEHHSMDEFHNNEDILCLVDICLNYYNTFIFDDIIGSMTVKNITSVEEFLNEAQNKYVSSIQITIFRKIKRCILTLFNNPQIKNLKGAFLEVLSFKIFEMKFNPYKTAKDCHVHIENWRSDLTVDIAMEYANSALICECKVPSSKFKWEIFKNLLTIESKSLNYFQPYIITLDTEDRIIAKKNRIQNTIPDASDINEIISIHRGNLGNLNLFN